jgi:uncharacterized membrane protein YsdA (DUF1294 family)
MGHILNTIVWKFAYYPLLYLCAISLLAVILVVHDKNAARRRARRVKERTLLVVSVLGGSAAMLLAMLAARHKTRRVKFMAGLPLILLAQITVAAFAFDPTLSVSHYSVKTDRIDGPIKLALLTDLHSYAYGDGQSELLGAGIARRAADIQPDGAME